MDISVSSTIERIKLQEQDKEAQLKEIRELEASLASTNRTIRETIIQTEKLQQEHQDLIQKTRTHRVTLEMETILLNALTEQVKASRKELEDLKVKSDCGISRVWELRSSLCGAVQNISNAYDVKALLLKPKSTNPCTPLTRPTETAHAKNEQNLLASEYKLKEAILRRDRATKQRDCLEVEPNCGEEFVRKFNLYRTRRLFSKNFEPNENKPIKFSTSEAANRTVNPLSMKKVNIEMPWYQPYAVVSSVAIFLIYFCALREENDVDMEFHKTLYDRIQGLEKQQLLQSYRYHKENGLDVSAIETRLRELDKEEAKLATLE